MNLYQKAAEQIREHLTQVSNRLQGPLTEEEAKELKIQIDEAILWALAIEKTQR